MLASEALANHQFKVPVKEMVVAAYRVTYQPVGAALTKDPTTATRLFQGDEEYEDVEGWNVVHVEPLYSINEFVSASGLTVV